MQWGTLCEMLQGTPQEKLQRALPGILRGTRLQGFKAISYMVNEISKVVAVRQF